MHSCPFRAESVHALAMQIPSLQCIILHCNLLYCTALHFTVLHCSILYCTALQSTTLHCSLLHCIALYCTALSYISLHCNIPYFTSFQYIAQWIFVKADWTLAVFCFIRIYRSSGGGIYVPYLFTLFAVVKTALVLSSYLSD